MARAYPAETLHGDLSQIQRDRVMRRFRTGQVELLVATDVAARGLDIEHVSHVINYDIPLDPEIYVHRDRPHRPRRDAPAGDHAGHAARAAHAARHRAHDRRADPAHAAADDRRCGRSGGAKSFKETLRETIDAAAGWNRI